MLGGYKARDRMREKQSRRRQSRGAAGGSPGGRGSAGGGQIHRGRAAVNATGNNGASDRTPRSNTVTSERRSAESRVQQRHPAITRSPPAPRSSAGGPSAPGSLPAPPARQPGAAQGSKAKGTTPPLCKCRALSRVFGETRQ